MNNDSYCLFTSASKCRWYDRLGWLFFGKKFAGVWQMV